MYPLILPATWSLSVHFGLDYGQSLEIFAHVSATVISGSVFGDHCSPISDTTILSSLSSSCNHIQHVRTQAPYALIVALISALFGTFLVESGLNIFIVYLIMIISTVLVIYFFGKHTEVEINKT
jgi:Na+/H+ antiporter NhaC